MSRPRPTSLLVTVGSTLFSALTDAILSSETLDVLSAQGIRSLKVQYGRASLPASLNGIVKMRDLAPDAGVGEFVWKGMEVEVFRYTDDFEGLVGESEGVVSHAGAGSILAVLRSKPPKPLLVVPNTSLMDNHQAQLAEQMEKQKYLMVSTPETLHKDLASFLDPARIGSLQPFPEFDGSRFRGIMDEMMGFKPDRL